MENELYSFLRLLHEESENTLILTSIRDYTKKILLSADVQVILREGKIIAMIAYYCNDYDTRRAFLSLVGVKRDYRGQSLASDLISCSIDRLRRTAFQNYTLEVRKDNSSAIRLYENFGFEVVSDNGEKWLMNLKL